MSRTLRGLVASLMAAGVVLGLAVPAGAQEETITEIVDITLDGCDIVVTFTAADAGEYHIQIWDDGEQIGDVPVTAEAGATTRGPLPADGRREAGRVGAEPVRRPGAPEMSTDEGRPAGGRPSPRPGTPRAVGGPSPRGVPARWPAAPTGRRRAGGRSSR
jgi:hypothetical protein